MSRPQGPVEPVRRPAGSPVLRRRQVVTGSVTGSVGLVGVVFVFTRVGTLFMVQFLVVVVALSGPLWVLAFAFARNRMLLVRRGSALAENVDDLIKVQQSDAHAFFKVPLAACAAHPSRYAPQVQTLPARLKPLEAARKGDFWPQLTVPERTALLEQAATVNFLAGSFLCKQADHADRVFVILSGLTEIRVTGRGVIAHRGPGDLVGERAALDVNVRSASVFAVETVAALVIETARFRSFVSRFPRVLTLVGDQMYERLTEAQPDPPQVRPPWFEGQYCPVLFVDVVSFTGAHRDDADRLEIRRALYAFFQRAAESSGVPWRECHREDRGDGVLLIAPSATPTGSLIKPLISRLAESLEDHNRLAPEATRFALRVALHVGPVESDGNGVNGTAINHTARLLDSPVLRQNLADSGADLGFIVSDAVYQSVVCHLPDRAERSEYRPAQFQVKESCIRAWIRLVRSPAERPRL
ncbi:MAG: cyclic nucleotide-binding domain-containing protein [Streptosporangiaceae bacterium]